jgi:hypothetical protein
MDPQAELLLRKAREDGPCLNLRCRRLSLDFMRNRPTRNS